jgi:hypothetical protein
VLGAIDLDPASNARAQLIVKAARDFTIEDDGLAHPWRGRVWLNPPYHRGLLPAFVDKLVGEIEARRVVAAAIWDCERAGPPPGPARTATLQSQPNLARSSGAPV